MKDINILITSAGRRVELILCFLRAKERLNIKGNVVAADMSETAPACFFADKKHKICRITDEEYIPQIIDICIKENIDLVVPTIDTELIKLAENKELIEEKTNAKVLISSREVINICRDKYKTADFFRNNGFNTPRYICENDIKEKKYEFPLFIKPLDGSSSVNAFKVNDEYELKFFTKYVKDYILQEFVSGKEYTVDLFCDFEGKPVSIVPRERLAVRSGEILKGVTERNEAIIEEVTRVADILKPIGQITLQGILTERGFFFIEINPRFGGGAPMSIASGADSCENLYRLLSGQELDYGNSFEEGMLGIRFDRAIFVKKDGQVIKDR